MAQQTPYNKVNIVDADGNLVNIGGGNSGGATATNQQTEIDTLTNNFGSDITGATMPGGGSGIRGWLSAIYTFIASKLAWTLNNGRLPVDVASLSVSVSNAQLEIANDSGNPIPVSRVLGVIANRSFVNANISVTTLLAANINRKKAIFKNNSTTQTWFLIYGNGGSPTDYTLDLLPGDIYAETSYTGLINGICSGATAATLLITEIS